MNVECISLYSLNEHQKSMAVHIILPACNIKCPINRIYTTPHTYHVLRQSVNQIAEQFGKKRHFSNIFNDLLI